MTCLTSGSSTPSVSLHLQGAPAPQTQPKSASHGLFGWFSHIQDPKQTFR